MINGIIHSGQEIVTDGLVLHLDAAQLRSYPTTGTTWTDLSGGGNDGTLINGPTFNSSNGGSIVFDGANDYGSIPNSSNLNIKTDGHSENVWVKVNNTTTQRITYKRFGGFGYGYSLYIASNAIGYEILTPNRFIQMTTPTISSGLWYNVSVSISRSSTSYIYLNGVIAATGDYSSLSGLDITNTFPLTIAAVNPMIALSSYLNGNLNTVLMYNRTLSATEILQNYNATKSRFGL